MDDEKKLLSHNKRIPKVMPKINLLSFKKKELKNPIKNNLFSNCRLCGNELKTTSQKKFGFCAFC